MASYETEHVQSSVTKRTDDAKATSAAAAAKHGLQKKGFPLLFFCKASHMGKEAKTETEAEASVTKEAAKKKAG